AVAATPASPLQLARRRRRRRRYLVEHSMRLLLRNLLTPLSLLFLVGTAHGVGTSHWTHTTEADFKAGTFHNVVATNLGDLKLSRAVKTILGQNEHVSAVHALVEAPDGTIYAGTGPEGVLLAVKNDKAETIADLGEK